MTEWSAGRVAEELLARRRARESLIDYVRYLDLGFEPAAHHRLIIHELEAVERGECPRLMIFCPPGSAKSTYASVLFPAWYLGRRPQGSIIAASHTEELADRFGRRVRNLVASEAHRTISGVAIGQPYPTRGAQARRAMRKQMLPPFFLENFAPRTCGPPCGRLGSGRLSTGRAIAP